MSDPHALAAGLKHVRAKRDDRFRHIYDIYVDFFGRSVYFFSIRSISDMLTSSIFSSSPFSLIRIFFGANSYKFFGA